MYFITWVLIAVTILTSPSGEELLFSLVIQATRGSSRLQAKAVPGSGPGDPGSRGQTQNLPLCCQALYPLSYVVLPRLHQRTLHIRTVSVNFATRFFSLTIAFKPSLFLYKHKIDNNVHFSRCGTFFFFAISVGVVP